MFRAISDYFFGGAAEEPQSTPLETQEVNDWLVVNLADRPENDLVMIESIKPDPMSESEYEDILDAVSCLMRPVEEPESELEPSDGESTVESSDCEEENDEEEKEEEEEVKKDVCFLQNSSASRRDFHYYCKTEALVAPKPKVIKPVLDPYIRAYLKLKSLQQQHLLEQEVVQHFETSRLNPTNSLKRLSVHHFDSKELAQAQEVTEDGNQELVKTITPLPGPKIRFMTEAATREVYDPFKFAVEFMKKMPTIRNQVRGSIMDVFLEHRRQNLVEEDRIVREEFRVERPYRPKPEKVLTNGQLNRQNKNYLFQSSCKKNRRRDLQRSHSGANNNRKCSC